MMMIIGLTPICLRLHRLDDLLSEFVHATLIGIFGVIYAHGRPS